MKELGQSANTLDDNSPPTERFVQLKMPPTETRAKGLEANTVGPILVVALAQLLGTSLWFSANSAADDLMQAWGATAADIGLLTGAVQLGFILGTLTLGLSGIADRFPASRLFVCSAILGAVFNACFALLSKGVLSGVALRFMVGICLAGIYPLGMKLIVSWNPQRASASLALLVGMLTLGTALPHALRSIGMGVPWQYVIFASSALATIAAALIFVLGDGPHLSVALPRQALKKSTVLKAFRIPAFRAASLGYFGHMWELYAFWTLVPMLVVLTQLDKRIAWGGVSAISFAVIAAGTAGCLLGGALSRRFGSARVAAAALALSGLCCLFFPWVSTNASPVALLAFLLIWGAAVVADSPQFSAIASSSCPPQAVGSALAMQNSAGFAITIVSIAVVTMLFDRLGPSVSWVLLPGPLLGLIGLYPLLGRRLP